jgi:2-polyprenyl-3-methyl-5-hydroxy-6-metoxy-1,4-benzoquinol methylase
MGTKLKLRDSIASPPPRAHYDHSYEGKKRLASYWHQIDECLRIGGQSILVVGKGSGLVSILLEKRGFIVTTVDIQAELLPLVIADVRQLPFLNESFDIVVCCEVLEHLPFEWFVPTLGELRRIVRRGVVLSLPDRGTYSRVLPYLLCRRRVVMDLPSVWVKKWLFDGEHYWEVGTSGHRLSDVQQAIGRANLKVESTFRVWEYPYHRFWRLRATEADNTITAVE